MRLIDAEPIKKFIAGGLNNPDRKKAFGYDAIQILTEIEFADTVDAVPVVRCKDCEHFYHSVSSDRDGRCVQFGTYDTDPSVYLNDFCSYGERKTEDG